MYYVCQYMLFWKSYLTLPIVIGYICIMYVNICYLKAISHIVFIKVIKVVLIFIKKRFIARYISEVAVILRKPLTFHDL